MLGLGLVAGCFSEFGDYVASDTTTGAAGAGGAGGGGGSTGGAHAVVIHIGNEHPDRVLGFAVHPATGRIATAGTFGGVLDLGAPPLSVSGDDRGAYIALFEADGTLLWRTQVAAASVAVGEPGLALAFDNQGDVVVVGAIPQGGSLDFGTGEHAAEGFPDAFVAKLSGVNGTELWFERLGDANSSLGGDMAITADNHIVIVGSFCGAVPLERPCTSLTSGCAGNLDVFLVELNEDGQCVRATSMSGSDPAQQIGGAVSHTREGTVISGLFNGTIDCGGGHAAVPTVAGEYDVYVATLDPSWSCTHIVNVGSQATSVGFVHAYGRGSDVVFGGTIGQVHVGSPTPQGGLDVLVGALAAGVPQGVALYGGPGADVAALWPRPDGGFVLAGAFSGTGRARFDGPVAAAGGLDGFYFALSPTLEPRAFESFGSPGDEVLSGVGFDDAGREAVRGLFDGSLTVERTTLISRGDSDVFIVVRDATPL